MERHELVGLVTSAMSDTQFNSKAARQLLIDWSESNVDLRAELVFFGADQLIRNIVHSERHAASPSPEAAREERAEADRRTQLSPVELTERLEQKTNRRLFWDRYALFGHLPLREATRPDLAASISSRKKQAAGNLACADFEDRVRLKLKNDTHKVGDVLKVDSLMKIAKECNVI